MPDPINKHVVIVGLDRMGNYNLMTDAPNMDRIFKNGAKSYYFQSLYPTISVKNRGPMLIRA